MRALVISSIVSKTNEISTALHLEIDITLEKYSNKFRFNSQLPCVLQLRSEHARIVYSFSCLFRCVYMAQNACCRRDMLFKSSTLKQKNWTELKYTEVR